MIISNICNFRSTEFDMREFTWNFSNVHFHSMNKAAKKNLPVNISFRWFLEFFVSVFARCALHIVHSTVQILYRVERFFCWLINVHLDFLDVYCQYDNLSRILAFLAFDEWLSYTYNIIVDFWATKLSASNEGIILET